MRAPHVLRFLVLVAFVLGCTGMAWRSSLENREDQRLISHTHEVLEEISGILALVRDAESAVRGYIASGNESFLQSYQSQRAAILDSDDKLRALVSDNPVQVARVGRLKTALRDRVDRFDELIRIRQDSGADAAVAGLTPGRVLSEKARAVMTEMEEEERRLLKLRHEESDASLRKTLVSFVLLAVAVIAVLAALFLAARHAEKVRRGMQIEIDRFFTASLDLMGVADLSTGKFIRLSPSWESTLGWRREEVMSRTWLDLVHPDDREATIKAAEQLSQGKDLLIFENRYRHKDGSYRWISWRVPAPEPGAKVTYSIARDVTIQKEREETIRRLNEDLRNKVEEALAANKELEAFSYSVSHDLRAPLRAVDGFARILREDFEAVLGAEGVRLLGKVIDSSRQMGELIDDLLQYSRLGRKEIETTRVDMDALVRDSVLEVGKDHPTRAEVVVGPLPAVRGDRALLKQVWVNLVSNAFKYSSKNPAGRIEIAGENGGAEAVFHVRDNGVGFDMAYSNKLFGVFQRLHSAREFEGTGVGLAIVHRVVNRHGGRVWAEGKPDAGAAFHFSIPTSAEGT